MSVVPWTGLLMVSVLVSGCDRTHIHSNFGEANRAAFQSQVLHPDAGNDVKPNPPLDPEEAAAIARTHLKSLTPPSAVATSHRDPILMVSPTPAGTATPDPVR